jgi:hypothetical protein
VSFEILYTLYQINEREFISLIFTSLVDSALYHIRTRFILKTGFDSIYWIIRDYKSIYFTIYGYLVCDVAFYLD